ncbi:unnamed protein product [Haemonchus placei]|uniref:Uncharacterized protein n=1 Tax=Haemonchus placei TaxID=6290 RepID=A0A0N4WFY4_HAEPC|nr:unnamed protein product [Haemonchus placei]
MHILLPIVSSPIPYDAPPSMAKRAQTFVRFGKRAQTFVRFGKRAQTFVRFGRSNPETSALRTYIISTNRMDNIGDLDSGNGPDPNLVVVQNPFGCTSTPP